MKRLCHLALAAAITVGLVAGSVLGRTYKGSGEKSPEGAWLGVYMQTIDDKMVEAFDLATDFGVLINEVVDGSPAEEAGLEEDDIIIRFAGEKIFDTDDLIKMVRKHSPGDEVEVTIIRNSREDDLIIALGERPNEKKFQWVPKAKGKSYAFSFHDDDRPFMGVHLMDLNRQLGDYFGVPKARGALITEVEEDSPAEQAGLKAGDVIVGVDDDKVYDSKDVTELIAEKEPGDKVEVAVVRDRAQRSFTVEVGEAADDKDYSFFLHGRDPDQWLPLLQRLPEAPEAPELQLFDDEDYRLDMKEFKKEMKEFKQQMKLFQEEMEKLKEKLD